jgi:hypothetical protein
MLQEAAGVHPELLRESLAARPLLTLVAQDSPADRIAAAILEEELLERERDRVYWQPLKAELAEMRRTKNALPRRGELL